MSKRDDPINDITEIVAPGSTVRAHNDAGTGRVMQNDVHRETPSGDVGFGDRVGTLELAVGSFRVWEPKPQPRSGFGDRVVEQSRRLHADANEMRSD